MSKPALGRGLGSLLSREDSARPTPFSVPAVNGGNTPGAEVPVSVRPEAPKAGVTLLLSGRESREAAISGAEPSDPAEGVSAADERSSIDFVGKPAQDGRVPVAPDPVFPSAESLGDRVVLPGWILPALYASDAVMLCVGVFWTLAGSGNWRWLGIGSLLAVGCVQTLVAWHLQQGRDSAPPSAERWPAPGEPAGGVPRLRVHFVDELPRNRR